MNTIRSGRSNDDSVVDGGAVDGGAVDGGAVDGGAVDGGVVDGGVVDDDVLDDVVAGEVLDDGSRAGSDSTTTTGDDDDGFAGIPPRACPIRTPASVAHAVTTTAASTTNALRLLTCSHPRSPEPYIRPDSVAWHATFARKRTQL